MKRMPGVRDPDAERYVSLTLAQEIHTPEDITLENPPLDDRPYAGMLYLDSVVYRRTQRMNDAWTLRLGVVGPASRADDTQTWVHDLIGADEPRGWRTQLPNELVVNLGYGDYALNFNVAFSSDDTAGRGDAVDFGALTLTRRFR